MGGCGLRSKNSNEKKNIPEKKTYVDDVIFTDPNPNYEDITNHIKYKPNLAYPNTHKQHYIKPIPKHKKPVCNNTTSYNDYMWAMMNSNNEYDSHCDKNKALP